jgi:hypothetical protein
VYAQMPGYFTQATGAKLCLLLGKVILGEVA